MQTLWVWWPHQGFRVYRGDEFPADWERTTENMHVELHHVLPVWDKALQNRLCDCFHAAHFNSEYYWHPTSAEHAYTQARSAQDFLGALAILQSFWRTGA